MVPQHWQFFSETMRKSFAEGEAKGQVRGRAKAIVRFLAARGLTVTQEQRDRIFACTDLDTLSRWVDKAATVASTDELFAE
jgi:hypothetical protein